MRLYENRARPGGQRQAEGWLHCSSPRHSHAPIKLAREGEIRADLGRIFVNRQLTITPLFQFGPQANSIGSDQGLVSLLEHDLFERDFFPKAGVHPRVKSGADHALICYVDQQPFYENAFGA
jgi:hypothetical protein